MNAAPPQSVAKDEQKMSAAELQRQAQHSPGEDVQSHEVALGVTVLASLGGGHVHDLQRLAKASAPGAR